MGEEPAPREKTFFQIYGMTLIFAGISVFFIVTSLILLFKTLHTGEPIRFSSDEASQSARQRMVTVDIEGAVSNPGVYETAEGSRIGDLLDHAGGLTPEADNEWVGKTLNRASILTDGAKLYIPKKGEVQGDSDVGKKREDGGRQTEGIGGVISLNTASEKELDTLPGVGEVTARKIIDNRPYQRTEELLERKIVGASVYEKIKGLITL